jgi:hypothetical protein
MIPDKLILDYAPVGAKTADPHLAIVKNLSAVAQINDYLWTASDEGRTIECLRWKGDHFGDAQSFELDRYFRLPQGKSEIDVEGLAIEGNTLWIAGSHSMSRKNVPPQGPNTEPDEAAATESSDPLKHLAHIGKRPRRHLLGRLELKADGSAPAVVADQRCPCLPFEGDDDRLRPLLSDDAHLGAFIHLPDKENGLDIEGLAAHGGRVMLGLRGPVLRSEFAVILEIAPVERDGALHLGNVDGGQRYRKHFVPLGGCGVRDLFCLGEDLVILSGPTMGLPGPFACWIWQGGMTGGPSSFVQATKLVPGPILTTNDNEHPEGIARIKVPDGPAGWIVLYDNPTPSRYTSKGRYTADFIPL